MPVEMPQVLAVIGQFPVQHGAKTVIERLMAAKSTLPFAATAMGGGGMTGIFQSIAGGNLAGVFQNPMAAIGGVFQGQIGAVMALVNPILTPATSSTNAQGQTVTTPAVPNPLYVSFQNLVAALNNVYGAAQRLSGLSTPPSGSYGVLDVLAFGNLSDIIGGSYSTDVVLGPVRSATTIEDLIGSLAPLFASITAGTTPANAKDQIDAAVSQLNSIVTASDAAIAGLQAASVPIATIGAIAGALTSNSGIDTTSYLASILQPAVLAQLGSILGPVVPPSQTGATDPSDTTD